MEELNQVIIDNQRLIYAITNYFKNYNHKDDLYQVGVIGLINAYYNYDPMVNVKFSTYAYPYILGEMKKLVREDKGIKISREISKRNLKIEKAKVLLTQRLMREPSIKELSDFLEIPEIYVVEAVKSTNLIQSLDEPVNELSLYEVIGDKETDLDMLMALKAEIERLKASDKEIIETRYMQDLTQTEAAEVLGMSQVQVSRKEKKILVKLKNNLVNYN
ncbi:MAG: sigma-70 family RNA polymerase sigma factor [Bacilli bacterium]|nr:sigma-70 family RNA polymerase sigma factor [Bacilli bacterium]